MRLFALALAFLALPPLAENQTTPQGLEPVETLGARDLASDFKLPTLKDGPRDTLRKEQEELQVLVRAKALGLDGHSSTQAWKDAEAVFRNARKETDRRHNPADAIVFSGSLSSELNKLLARDGVSFVRVTSEQLSVDEPIRLSRPGVELDFGSAELKQATKMPYLIRIERTRDVELRGGKLLRGSWGVLVSSSDQVRLSGVELRDLDGGGVLVTNCDDVVISKSRFRSLHGAGVLLNGETQDVVVTDNEMQQGLGSSNWNAGIVVTDRSADLATNPDNLFAEDRYWVPEASIVSRLHGPRHNVIAYNAISGNASSGIYSDGSTSNVFVGNRIERNSKEGICLDNGSSADVVAFNLFRGNGDRWGKSDAELELDFVGSLGRLKDGSSPAKVPAISVDNAAYNEIAFNEIDANFGGGIKLVRTALYNVIGLNTLTDNNAGQNHLFHFFGIEVGAAKGDVASAELDFVPSRGNLIFGNTIRGPHYAGIFFAAGSDGNDVFDNSIFGATDWAMESEVIQANSSLNNLTNEKSRNISSGIDPALMVLGQAINDTKPAAPAENPKPAAHVRISPAASGPPQR